MRALTFAFIVVKLSWAEGGTGNRKHRYIDVLLCTAQLFPVVSRGNETLFKVSFGTSEFEHCSEENVLNGEGLLTWVD